jgi:HlyD family secretion protein
MTATAEIEVQRDHQVLLAPNAALRFEPPEREASPERSGLARLIPNKHQFDLSLGAAGHDAAPHVWVLQRGKLRRVPVEAEGSDGSWTEIRSDALGPGASLVVDAPGARG